MNIVTVYFVVFFAHSTIGHMPNVNEFCAYIVANNDPQKPACDPAQCQGRPGKVGAHGPRGLPGSKGQKGDEGSCESMASKIQRLEESVTEAKIKYEQLPIAVRCYMGMKSGDIQDSAITSSSDYSTNHAARLGRLDNEGGAWVAGRRSPDEWIQVDFGVAKFVAGIVTQGTAVANEWVKTFKVQCGNSTDTLEFVTENDLVKIFNGNKDQNTKVFNLLPSPMKCRYIRLYTLSWYSYNAMRLEFICGNCYDLF